MDIHFLIADTREMRWTRSSLGIIGSEERMMGAMGTRFSKGISQIFEGRDNFEALWSSCEAEITSLSRIQYLSSLTGFDDLVSCQ